MDHHEVGFRFACRRFKRISFTSKMAVGYGIGTKSTRGTLAWCLSTGPMACPEKELQESPTRQHNSPKTRLTGARNSGRAVKSSALGICRRHLLLHAEIAQEERWNLSRVIDVEPAAQHANL